MKKVKKQVISIGFFSYFTWGILSKPDVVVVKSLELKFMAIIARNAKFKGCWGQIFA